MADCKVKQTVKSLREAANKLDQVWKDCKKAHAFGTAGGIASGLISLGATVLTGGAASPLLLASGLSLGLGGAAINLWSSYTETARNSDEVKRAQRLLKDTSDCMNEVNDHVKFWLNTKEKARLLYICCCLAKQLKPSPWVMNLLLEVMSFCCKSTSITFTMNKAGIVVTLTISFALLGSKTATVSVERAAAQVADEVAQVTGAAGAAGQACAQVADDVAQATGAAGAAGQACAQVADDVAQATEAAGAAGQACAQVADDLTQATGAAGAAGQAGAQVADDVAQLTGAAGQTGGKVGKNVTGKVSNATKAFVAVNVAFLMFDIIDMHYTIRDICENKGSEAAKYLRERANELEATMKQYKALALNKLEKMSNETPRI